MKGKVQLLALLAIFLAFSFFLYLSIAQEFVNSSQNLATDKNLDEQLASLNLGSEEDYSKQSVESQTTVASKFERTFSEDLSNEEKDNTSIQVDETQTNEVENRSIESVPKSKVYLKLNIDKKRIIRGEDFLLKVLVVNDGEAEAKNVKVIVDLPKGLSTEDSEKVCGTIVANSSCELEFFVKSNLSTRPGKNVIKVRVFYE